MLELLEFWRTKLAERLQSAALHLVRTREPSVCASELQTSVKCCAALRLTERDFVSHVLNGRDCLDFLEDIVTTVSRN